MWKKAKRNTRKIKKRKRKGLNISLEKKTLFIDGNSINYT